MAWTEAWMEGGVIVRPFAQMALPNRSIAATRLFAGADYLSTLRSARQAVSR